MGLFKKTIDAKLGFALMEDPFYFYAENIVVLSAWIAENCEQLGFTIEDVVIAKINRQTGSVYEWCVYVKLKDEEL